MILHLLIFSSLAVHGLTIHQADSTGQNNVPIEPETPGNVNNQEDVIAVTKRQISMYYQKTQKRDIPTVPDVEGSDDDEINTFENKSSEETLNEVVPSRNWTVPDTEEVEGSGDFPIGTSDDDKSWETIESTLDLGANRTKRQMEDSALLGQEIPVQAPIALAQRRRDSSGSDERRHGGRPNRPSCNTVRCTSGTECIIENGRPTCRPIRQPSRSCRDINCPRDTRCRMERDPRCRDRNCPEQPVCVRDSRASCSNVQCPFGLRCRIVEERGREFATCVPSSPSNSCDRIRCPPGTLCQFNGRDSVCAPIVSNPCANAICQPGFQCQVVNNQARCFPASGPVCGPNQVFNQCSSPCEPRCGQPAQTACILRCDPPSCQCAQGFWRHQSGSCVQQHQCFFG